MADATDHEAPSAVRTYLWWAGLFGGLVAVLGATAILRQVEMRPELVKDDKGFVWSMKALRGFGWSVLAYCLLVVVAGLHRLPGQKGGAEGGKS